MHDFHPGDILCHCTLIGRCGSGSYGEVFLAEDGVGARVAVKIVPNGGRYSERELAGLRNYRDCDHPNLLKIRHIEISPENVVYTMDAADDLHQGKGEYLPDTLANRLRLYKRLDGAEIETMLAGVLSGLEALHDKKLVHRDIKPDNILYVNGRPTLADAGLIVPAGQGSLVGTPGFLSPRLLTAGGHADARDDFYALGKVIYCALTGNPVEEYPSVPRDMTLSGNADWGKVFRTMCENPVSSAAEFRDFLQRVRLGAAFSCRKRRLMKRIFIAAAVLVTMAAVVLLGILRGKAQVAPEPPSKVPVASVPERSVVSVKSPARVPSDIVPPKPPAILKQGDIVVRRIDQTPPETEKKWNDGKNAVLQALRAGGFYDEDQWSLLGSAGEMPRIIFFERLLKCSGTPRMIEFYRPGREFGKKPSALELELAEICRDYQTEDPSFIHKRNQSWPKIFTLAVQRTKLAENEAMQSLALGIMIRKKIDDILIAGKISEKEKEDLKTWVALRNTLIGKKNEKKSVPATKK